MAQAVEKRVTKFSIDSNDLKAQLQFDQADQSVKETTYIGIIKDAH